MAFQLTQELHGLHKLVNLGQVDNHDSLDVRAVRRVTEDTEAGEEDGDNEHHAGQDRRELLRLAHRFGDGDDPAVSSSYRDV